MVVETRNPEPCSHCGQNPAIYPCESNVLKLGCNHMLCGSCAEFIGLRAYCPLTKNCRCLEK